MGKRKRKYWIRCCGVPMRNIQTQSNRIHVSYMKCEICGKIIK